MRDGIFLFLEAVTFFYELAQLLRKKYANVTQIQQWSSCNVSDDWMSKNAILVFRGLFFKNFLFLCGTAALGSHLTEGAVTYALYIGAVE